MAKTQEKKKQNSILVLSAVVGIVTVVIGGVFIFMPFLNNSKSLRAEILQERDKNILIGRIRALGKHRKVYKKRIPEGRGVSWLLSEISDLASKEKIEISSIKPGTPEDRGIYSKLYVTMDTFSTYDQLGRFLARVESSEKFFRVESINIKRVDLEGDFDKKVARFKAFDVKGNIVISAIVLNK